MPYNPGLLPRRSPPLPGEFFEITLPGLPPRKDRNRSIRNIGHKFYDRFVLLRDAATRSMDGRAPFRGIVGLELEMFCSQYYDYYTLIEFMGGIMDTLGGSHGPSFTYLPIIFEDDWQVSMGNLGISSSPKEFYTVKVTFTHKHDKSCSTNLSTDQTRHAG